MEALCAWMKNLVFYLIFMTFVTNLLPGKAYDRYFRLFTGMVLILLVLSPLTGSLNLDDRLACYFESISFQSEAGEYRGEIEEMDRKRLERLIGQYEEAASEDLEKRLSAAGCRGVRAQVKISRDRESSDFGTVEAVEVWVEGMEAEAGNDSADIEQKAGSKEENVGEQQGSGDSAVSVTGMKEELFRVTLGEWEESAGTEEGHDRDRQENRASGRGEESEGEAASQVSAPGVAGSREAVKIRKEIAEFYGLEENRIKVQMGEGRSGS